MLWCGVHLCYFLYLFVLSSGMENTTLSQMCGMLCLSIFLTLIYIASFISLAILCPSLPIIWKLSIVIVWPVVFWCSNIDEGAFKCSLYLSPNVLADSPIYSSSHSVLPHLNQYMTDIALFCCCILIFRKHQEIFQSFSSFEVYMNTIFATGGFVAFTKTL